MSASAIYNLCQSANYDVICQGLDEKEWVISKPNEIFQDITLLNMVVSRTGDILENASYYNIRKESYPAKKDSAHEKLILKVLDAGALPWQDNTVVFEKLLFRPFYKALDAVISHPSTSPTILKRLHSFEVNLKAFEGVESKLKLPALHVMAANGNEEGIKTLLKHGWDINGVDRHQRTPLFYARYPNMVQLLLDQGADAELRDKDKATAATYWGQKSYFTVAEVQTMQKTLPQVRRKKGSASEDDLNAFIQTILNAKKTKAIGEARRLGVSLEQEVDGKPMMEFVIDKVAEAAAHKLNTQKINHWDGLTKMEDSTASWLMEEWESKGTTARGLSNYVWLSFFSMLTKHFTPKLSSQTPEDLISNIEKAKEVEQLWFPWLKQIKPQERNGLARIEQMTQLWTSSLLNNQDSLWLLPTASGDIPLVKLYEVLEEWDEKTQVFNPNLKFHGFSLGPALISSYNSQFLKVARPNDEQCKDFLKHPRAFEIVLSTYFTSETEMLYSQSAYQAIHRQVKYDEFGFKESNTMYPFILHFINEGAVWPLNASLLDTQFEKVLGQSSHEALGRVRIFREQSLLRQKIDEAQVSPSSGGLTPKKRL